MGIQQGKTKLPNNLLWQRRAPCVQSPTQSQIRVALSEYTRSGKPRAEDRGARDEDVRQLVHVQVLQHLLRVRINVDLVRVNLGAVRNVLHATLALLLLELERDAAHRALLDALHEVSSEPGDLVPEALRLDLGNFLRDLLVDLEVERKLAVVLLNDQARSALDSLRPHATHGKSGKSNLRGA